MRFAIYGIVKPILNKRRWTMSEEAVTLSNALVGFRIAMRSPSMGGHQKDIERLLDVLDRKEVRESIITLGARVKELEEENRRILNLINTWASANTDSESEKLAESKLIDEVIEMPNMYAGEGEEAADE